MSVLKARLVLDHLRQIDRKQLREWAGVPRDARGIVLACGFAGAAGIGAATVSDHDPLGWAYIALACCGYLFVQSRAIPTLAWMIVTALALWAYSAGAPGAWVAVLFGLCLTLVSLLPATVPSALPNEPQPNLSETSAAVEVPLSIARPAPQLAIYTLGHFQVLVDGQDNTGRILDKPAVGGLWCYLLALAVRNPDSPIARTTLASQLWPRGNRSQQLERLRRQLWDVQHDLGALGDMVVADRSSVRFDLSAATVDALLLKQLCDDLRNNAGQPVTGELLLEVRRVLDESVDRTFLPDFERLAGDAGLDAMAARRTVTEARSNITVLRGELARLLAAQQAPKHIRPPHPSDAASQGDKR